MNLIKSAIDNAVADAMAEHPKYFTPKGHEHARAVIVRKIMAALRGDASEKSADQESAPPVATIPILVEPDSRQGRGYIVLRHIAGATAALRTDGKVSVPPEAQGEDVAALSDAPPESAWPLITDRREIGAWTEFFREKLPNAARRSVLVTRGDRTGIVVPWPWPPTKTGKVYESNEDAA